MMTPEEKKQVNQERMAKVRAAKKPKAPQQITEKRLARAMDAVAPGVGPLRGLTERECPMDCCPEKCVITGQPICGHPNKSGIQPAHKLNPEVLKRYNGARKALAQRDLDRQQAK